MRAAEHLRQARHSPAPQRDYAFGDLFEENVIKQDVMAFSVTGTLWQGWGAVPAVPWRPVLNTARKS